MGNFLDKVGLQHVIEKIKGLLSGYLPLEKGGTIGTGAPTTTLKAGNITLEGVGGNAHNPGTSIKKKVEISEKSITGTSSDETDPTFLINDSGITAKKFVLSGDSSSEGLIANNSETVVPEIASSVIDEVVQNKGAKYTDAGYVSKANLGRLVKNLYNNMNNLYTIIYAKGGNVTVRTSTGDVTIKPGINYSIYGDYIVIGGHENVYSIVRSGTTREYYNYFSGMSNLTFIDGYGLDTSNITNMIGYFSNCAKLSSDSLSSYLKYWNTSKVTRMSKMFFRCKALQSLVLNYWDTSNVTEMYAMFEECINLSSLNIDGWNTSKVTNMGNMFSDCEALTSLDLSRWDTSNVTNMSYMFSRCHSLSNLNIDGWNTSNVTNIRYMFNGCPTLTSLDLSRWDTSNVTDMTSMFNYSTGLSSLNLNGWNTCKVTEMRSMFSDCSAITTLILSEDFGRMKDEVGTLYLSALTNWTNESVQTLLTLYDRKANGLGVITIGLSAATKSALGTSGILTLTAKGYTIA